jgi:hypothetical protein
VKFANAGLASKEQEQEKGLAAACYRGCTSIEGGKSGPGDLLQVSRITHHEGWFKDC